MNLNKEIPSDYILLQTIEIKNSKNEVVLTKEMYVDESAYRRIIERIAFRERLDDYEIIIHSNMDRGTTTLNFNLKKSRNENGLIVSDNFNIYGVGYKIIRVREKSL